MQKGSKHFWYSFFLCLKRFWQILRYSTKIIFRFWQILRYPTKILSWKMLSVWGAPASVRTCSEQTNERPLLHVAPFQMCLHVWLSCSFSCFTQMYLQICISCGRDAPFHAFLICLVFFFRCYPAVVSDNAQMDFQMFFSFVFIQVLPSCIFRYCSDAFSNVAPFQMHFQMLDVA